MGYNDYDNGEDRTRAEVRNAKGVARAIISQAVSTENDARLQSAVQEAADGIFVEPPVMPSRKG